MSAPDRIWIEVAPQFPAKIPPFPSWNDDEADPSMNQTVEYVRADLCAPTQGERVKALEAENARLRDDLADAMTAIKECKDEIDQSIINEYPHDHPVQERYRKRDFAANPARVFLDRRAALRALEQGEA